MREARIPAFGEWIKPKPKIDIFEPTETARDLAFNRVLRLSVEQLIAGNTDESYRLFQRAKEYCFTAPDQLFEREEN